MLIESANWIGSLGVYRVIDHKMSFDVEQFFLLFSFVVCFTAILKCDDDDFDELICSYSNEVALKFPCELKDWIL